MKSMLVAFAVMALWMSTFSGCAGASEVRKTILLGTFMAAGFAALYNRGRRRAFWAGFVAVMLVCGGLSVQRPLDRYTPDFNWQWALFSGNTSPSVTPIPTAFAIVPTQPYSGPATIAWPPYAPPPVYNPGSTVYAPADSMLSVHIGATIAAAWTLAL
jgi:hypothetical protein